MPHSKVFLICRNYAKTPVIKWYIELLQERGVKIEEIVYYTNRLRFLYKAIKAIIFKSDKNDLVLCVGFQSLPILILTWFFDRIWVYWKLESHNPFEDWSFVSKLQFIEWIIKRDSVLIALPSSERLKIQKPHFNKSHIVYNAPTSFFIDKLSSSNQYEISNKEKYKLFVLYGNLAKGSIYLDEWISFFNNINFNCEYELTLIGRWSNPLKEESKDLSHLNIPDLGEKISYLGEMLHSDLISKLSGGFGYSIVGYKGTSQNTIYAAPNKLLESLSCGVPIIGHQGNPYVKEIIEKYNCGFLIDFENINYLELEKNISNWILHKKAAITAAYVMSLDISIKESVLDVTF